MAIDQVDRTVVTQAGATPAGQETVQTDSRRITRSGRGGSEMARRVVVLVFGLIQLVIGARIILLLLDAREANALVAGILERQPGVRRAVRGDPPDGLAQSPRARCSTSPPSWPSSAGRSSS